VKKTFEKVSGYRIQVLNIAQFRVVLKKVSMARELEVFQFYKLLEILLKFDLMVSFNCQIGN